MLSWLLLGGKSACCKSQIPKRYVLTEAVMAVAAGVAATSGWKYAVIACVLSGFVVLKVSKTLHEHSSVR